MSISIVPFLMFEGNAEEAMNLYLKTIPNSNIISIERYGSDADGAEGTVNQASMEIAGQTVRFFDSPIEHKFTFTPATSFFISCDDESQFDSIVDQLGNRGEFLMPPNDYGFSKKYAWLNDRFGVSWQINFL